MNEFRFVVYNIASSKQIYYGGNMNNLQLKDDLKVSKLILGTVNFGTGLSKEHSFEMMDYYFAKGGNTFDTARAYCGWIKGGEFKSEETLGQWVKERNVRDKVIIITKGGHPSFEDPLFKPRLSEEEIRYDMEVSLKTLQMDYVDLYLLHRDDESRPVSEIVDTLDRLVKEGKTRYVGVSNWTVSRIIEANKYAKENNKVEICSSEIQWSLAECFPRTFNDETLICMNKEIYDEYMKLDMPILAYSSQAGGVFSCGYNRRLEDIAPKHMKYLSVENVIRYGKLLDLCEKKNYEPSSAALQYITDNKLKAAAIIGASKMEQLMESMKEAESLLTEDEIAELV